MICRSKNVLVYITFGVVILLLSVASNSGIAQTEVIGFIEQDTTWTRANSPYSILGPIVVNKGITVTIEPGVTVDMNEHDLKINGALVAKGTASSNIKFVRSSKTKGWDISLTGSGVSAKYDGNGNYLSGSILQYCSLESVSINGAFYIDHCEMKEGTIKISDTQTAVISHTKISGDIARRGKLTFYAEVISVNECLKLVLKNNVLACNEGINIRNGRNITLQGNTLVSNGGLGQGVHIRNVQNVSLTGNSITGYGDAHISWPNKIYDDMGGGIYLYKCKKVNLLNNIVRQCRRGGGIYIDRADDISIRDNTIAENSSYYDGSGLHIEGDLISIENNTITGNTSGMHGGGITVYGSKVIITHNTIIGNYGNYGGGLRSPGGSLVIAYNIISGNEAERGGGISIRSETSATINSNLLAGNSADRGGGLHCNVSVEVTNNTIIDNIGYSGAAIVYYGNKKITDNIISNNKGKEEGRGSTVHIEGNPVFTRNVITDNTTDVAVTYEGGRGNLNAKNNYWGTTQKTDVLKTHDYLTIDAIPFLTENPVGSLLIDMEPKAIFADGTSTATITVLIKGANDALVKDEPLKVVKEAIGGRLSEVHNNSDGTYTATYTASNEVGKEKIWVVAPQSRLAKSIDVPLLKPVTYQSRSLNIPLVKARAGKNVVASVTIDNPSSIAKIDINLDYNPKLLAVRNVTHTKLTKDASLTTNTESIGKLSFSLSNSKGIANGLGSLVNIEFQVKEDAPYEEMPIKFENIALYDKFGRPIPFSHIDGSILIKGGPSLWIFVGIAAVVVVAFILFAVVRSKKNPQVEGQL